MHREREGSFEKPQSKTFKGVRTSFNKKSFSASHRYLISRTVGVVYFTLIVFTSGLAQNKSSLGRLQRSLHNCLFLTYYALN